MPGRPERRKERADRSRALLIEYLYAHPCEVCGEDDPLTLVVDTKDKDPASMINQGLSWAKIFAEIEKSRVLCGSHALKANRIAQHGRIAEMILERTHA